MKASYKDIRLRLGKPQWWDENGVPRYARFLPDLCANIYAQEAVLYQIACQNCGQTFDVVSSWGEWDRLGDEHRRSLRDLIDARDLHYGDPPNIGCCPSGPTMNSIPLRTLEYWYREEKAGVIWFRNRDWEKLDIRPDWAGDEEE